MATDTQQAAAEAADLLREHTDHPAIAAVVATLGTIEDASEPLEKSLGNVQRARAEIKKSGDLDADLDTRLFKAERVLMHELMMKRSVGYRNAQANRDAEELRRAANLAGRGAA
jgi:hypothetical protein